MGNTAASPRSRRQAHKTTRSGLESLTIKAVVDDHNPEEGKRVSRVRKHSVCLVLGPAERPGMEARRDTDNNGESITPSIDIAGSYQVS